MTAEAPELVHRRERSSGSPIIAMGLLLFLLYSFSPHARIRFVFTQLIPISLNQAKGLKLGPQMKHGRNTDFPQAIRRSAR